MEWMERNKRADAEEGGEGTVEYYVGCGMEWSKREDAEEGGEGTVEYYVGCGMGWNGIRGKMLRREEREQLRIT